MEHQPHAVQRHADRAARVVVQGRVDRQLAADLLLADTGSSDMGRRRLRSLVTADQQSDGLGVLRRQEFKAAGRISLAAAQDPDIRRRQPECPSRPGGHRGRRGYATAIWHRSGLSEHRRGRPLCQSHRPQGGPGRERTGRRRARVADGAIGHAGIWLYRYQHLYLCGSPGGQRDGWRSERRRLRYQGLQALGGRGYRIEQRDALPQAAYFANHPGSQRDGDLMETPVPLHAIHSGQRGAVLVTSLVLLLVLTILAVAGINSVTMEYAMTGNEQFRANAFTAAEAGIEQSLAQGAFVPGAAAQTINAAMVNAPLDKYTAVIVPMLLGAPQNPPLSLGASIGKISSYQFEITSTGQSVRSAQSVNVQGVAVIAPYDPSIPPDPL